MCSDSDSVKRSRSRYERVSLAWKARRSELRNKTVSLLLLTPNTVHSTQHTVHISNQHMDTDYTISTALRFAKAVLYQILVLTQAVHHEFPFVYDAIKYIVAVYLCYRTALFAVRSLYTTILWIIRMMVIAYAVYIVVCVFSAIDATASGHMNSTDMDTDMDMDIIVDAAVSTAVRETKRLYTVGRVLASGLVVACRRLLRDASPTQLARDLGAVFAF